MVAYLDKFQLEELLHVIVSDYPEDRCDDVHGAITEVTERLQKYSNDW